LWQSKDFRGRSGLVIRSAGAKQSLGPHPPVSLFDITSKSFGVHQWRMMHLLAKCAS
jgi:hypothetical protein